MDLVGILNGRCVHSRFVMLLEQLCHRTRPEGGGEAIASGWDGDSSLDANVAPGLTQIWLKIII